MTRENETPNCTWTSFNKKHSTIHTEKTTTGYLPIIQAPANDLDTLNTVVRRILHIAQSLGQKFLVLTVDEGLFPKLMELKWSVPEYKDILIPRLVGLHTAMNFQGCLGQHMQDSGLGEIWTESGLLGDNSVQQIMAGKSYARSVRAHKLTFQALWHFLLPKLYSYLEVDKDYKTDLLESVQQYDTSCSVDTLTNILASDTFKSHMDTFVDHIKNENPNI